MRSGMLSRTAGADGQRRYAEAGTLPPGVHSLVANVLAASSAVSGTRPECFQYCGHCGRELIPSRPWNRCTTTQ
jgi:hypothetical protein